MPGMEVVPTSFFDLSPFDSHRRPTEASTANPPSSQTSASIGFLDLPGEVRNHIYEYVVIDATTSAGRDQSSHYKPGDEFKPIAHRFRVLVRPGYMYYRGIGPVSLLFVNKQIYEELASVIYSNMGTIWLRVTRFEHRKNHLTYRCTFESLNRWPNIQRYARKFKVTINAQENMWRDQRGWRIVDYKNQSDYVRWEWGKPFESKTLIKDLADYMQKFSSLATLKVIMRTNDKPSALTDLVPLYDLLDGKTMFQFKTLRAGGSDNVAWKEAWMAWLKQGGKVV